jgi:checkpoint serine/threonine-protein kinase
LDGLTEQLDKRRGFFYVNRSLPKIKLETTALKLGTDKYLIHDQRDEGSYAKIYAAQIVDEDDDDVTGATMALPKDGIKWFALKISKPPNAWEFYICDELHKRLARSKRPVDIELSVMCVKPAVLFKDATVLVDELCSNGSVIRIVNVLKAKNKTFPKALLGYLVLELLLVVKEMHAHHIIHADLKPDNVLVINFPIKEDIVAVQKAKRTSCIKIIDFGRAIDMVLFPANTVFTYKVETKGSQCPEMLDSRPWNYHTDWFGVLDIIHTLLFGEYIQLSEGGKSWGIKAKLNKRLHTKELWEPLFDELLNLESDAACPQIVDQTIQLLTEFVDMNANTIFKEAVELDSLMLQENAKRK